MINSVFREFSFRIELLRSQKYFCLIFLLILTELKKWSFKMFVSLEILLYIEERGIKIQRILV